MSEAKAVTKAAKRNGGAVAIESTGDGLPVLTKGGRVPKAVYEAELERLQAELVRMQYWCQHSGHRLVVIFEGRDASGKGGVIKRIAERLNPRWARIAALPAPSDREKSQWYFQRYVAELPAAGEIVLFDRSWYNRAGVERVMGFCTRDELEEFFRSCPSFETMLVSSGIQVVKYWLSVSDEEQDRRFQERVTDPMKRWKLSPMDLESRRRWVDYSRAKDEMLDRTDIGAAPWYIVESDDKRAARLNLITHLLSLVPYTDVTPPRIEVPERQPDDGYQRPPRDRHTMVPHLWGAHNLDAPVGLP